MAALAAGALMCARPAPASATVTLAVVPKGTTIADLARVPGMSLGVMSAGIGQVSAPKTYADISAGNREPAPSEAMPGLLQTTLAHAGRAAGFRRISAGPGGLAALVRSLRDGDLLIALAAPPPRGDQALPIGIAGAGFHGTLTSDSTRTSGYVLSTDLAPTILRRLRVPMPDEMNGEPIRAEGEVDPGAVVDRAARMTAVAQRRVPVLVGCLAAWLVLAIAIGLAAPARRRAAAAWLGLAFGYMPLLLLAGAALEASAALEAVLVGIGAAGLGALTLTCARGWWAAAVACAVTVGAYAIDMLTGSELTRLSLLGPNPIYGARFFGIGNELEALFAVMVPVGVAAGLTAYRGWGREVSRRATINAFLGAGVLAAIVFGSGRWGADVGAAIVLPLGAVVAALLVPDQIDGASASLSPIRTRKRSYLLLVGAPFIALLLLAFIDLVSGANAHLTRTVLDAGGAGNLADTAERRLRLSAHDFARAAANPLFWLVVAAIGAATWRWRRIDAWLRPAPLVRAGVIGACAAVAAGVLVNDSGATFLVLGSLALGASLAFAWAQAPGRDP